MTNLEFNPEGFIYSKVKGVFLRKFPEFEDYRGKLTVGEFPHDVPFEVKRFFLTYAIPSEEVRGEHAHRSCQQFIFCVAGKLTFTVDDGKNKEDFLLSDPTVGLYVPPMTWGVQSNYSNDAVQLVLASQWYNSEDYIRYYDNFLNLVQQ